MVKSGVEVRLEGALNRINREITTLNDIGQMPLRTIKVSVFGFDFGATLARAFVHELLGRCQQRDSEYYHSNARLEIVFAGLFDAVDRSAAELPPLEYALPLTNRIDDGGLIHPEVKASGQHPSLCQLRWRNCFPSSYMIKWCCQQRSGALAAFQAKTFSPFAALTVPGASYLRSGGKALSR